MKFMVTWEVHDHARHDALAAFSHMTDEELAADTGDDIRMIGRWHDLAGFTGVAICESDSAEAMANFALNWNEILDIDVRMVFDDDEARAIGRARAK